MDWTTPANAAVYPFPVVVGDGVEITVPEQVMLFEVDLNDVLGQDHVVEGKPSTASRVQKSCLATTIGSVENQVSIITIVLPTPPIQTLLSHTSRDCLQDLASAERRAKAPQHSVRTNTEGRMVANQGLQRLQSHQSAQGSHRLETELSEASSCWFAASTLVKRASAEVCQRQIASVRRSAARSNECPDDTSGKDWAAAGHGLIRSSAATPWRRRTQEVTESWAAGNLPPTGHTSCASKSV